MANRWEIRGKQLLSELENTTDERVIESLAKSVVDEIIEYYPDTPNSRKLPLTTVRKVVLSTFPTREDKCDNYYFTNSGKGKIERYEHLALKYLTFEDWDTLGHKSSDAEPIQTNKQFKLTDMNIEQLEFDTVTYDEVVEALNNSGKSLVDFVHQACKVYARTLNGKRKVVDSPLTNVPTSELLDNKEYKTHPRRIEELTKRAIKAIQSYNDNCTETNQKWFISGTAIGNLTGCRVQAINEVLKQYKEFVDSHNNSHELTAYTNRGNGRKIEDDIKLSELVPDGLDL